VKRLTLQPGVVLTLAVLAATSCVNAQTGPRTATVFGQGTISGVIRDTDGMPQMGALVQAMLPDATLAGSAITDARGRYRFSLQPGSYRIRATAALLLPAIRERLQIGHGTRAVVDLTLTTVLAPNGWLPVARRSVSEPSDDWMWTLRSSVNRSILRLNGPDDTVESDAAGTTISSSRQESRRGASGGRITLNDSDGGFGRGGSHQVVLLTRLNEDGSAAILRADLSGPRTPYPVAPSAEVSVGMQRRTPLNGFNRAVFSYSGHPELVDSRGNTGLQGATLRTVQRIEFGDLLRVDAGSVMRDSNLGGNALVVEPFMRVAARAGDGVVLAYSMTRSRGTESADDLNRVQPATPVAVYRNGHTQLETGSHHAVSVQGKVPGGGTVELALYRDKLHNPMIAGTGNLGAADMQLGGLVADPTTHTFRLAAKDYNSAGVRLTAHQPITKSLQAGAEFTTGNALRGARLQNASMSDVLNGLQAQRVYAATAFIDGKILRTGTTIRSSYRWQPQRTLTTVDAFRIGDDSAYLSCSLRQALGKTHFLPQGLEAVIDLQNLLAEGYQPFLSNDGQTLYLAQTPRTLQAGLSFSF
jgi:hypothetical protein